MPLISLGSNVTSSAGNPEQTVRAAIETLNNGRDSVLASSRLFATPAYPPGSGPDFVNAAVEVSTELHPAEFLARLHEIERELGRDRRERWSPRTLDLDFLASGDLVLPDTASVRHWMDLPLKYQALTAPDQFLLPHPRLHERAFVLVPLNDIAPEWKHPLLGRTVRQLVDGLPEELKEAIVPL